MTDFSDIVTVLKTDYSDYGGEIVRWENEDEEYPDCSFGCTWFTRTDLDFGICKKPGGPREGLLTFEHQAGKDCFEHNI